MRVLITGAVEGLGRALAEQLLAGGHQVVAVDRDREGLHAMTQSHVGECDSRLVDLANRMEVDDLAKHPRAGPFDLVILSAGVSATGKFEDIPATAYQRLIDINLRAPIVLASGLVRGGHIAKGGKVVFISSLSHIVGYPGASVYAASKDAIAVYAKSVRKAFRKRGVGILTVFPGPLRTNHAQKHAPADAKAEKRMPPEKAAKAILRAARGKKSRLFPGATARLAAWGGAAAPKLATKAMRKAIFDKLDRTEY